MVLALRHGAPCFGAENNHVMNGELEGEKGTWTACLRQANHSCFVEDSAAKCGPLLKRITTFSHGVGQTLLKSK